MKWIRDFSKRLLLVSHAAILKLSLARSERKSVFLFAKNITINMPYLHRAKCLSLKVMTELTFPFQTLTT